MPTTVLSPPEALIYAMVTTSAVDNQMSDTELARIGATVKELPAFAGFDPDTIILHAQACGSMVSGPDGLEMVLSAIAEALPANLYETAYALAADVAASDTRLRLEERRFLDLLAGALDLDKLTCAALERAAKARNRRL
ncbi:MAG: tellurite resistance TerB family protein [Hyphomicrobiaceae bacterium]|nr:tellurite resistance TerB family protein [Hyphomicrobiaceae bacterium]